MQNYLHLFVFKAVEALSMLHEHLSVVNLYKTLSLTKTHGSCSHGRFTMTMFLLKLGGEGTFPTKSNQGIVGHGKSEHVNGASAHKMQWMQMGKTYTLM